MKSTLHIEYFDTDARYKHRLMLPLRAPHAFRVGEGDTLHVDHADGSVHFVPLLNVKQYHEIQNSAPEADALSAQIPSAGETQLRRTLNRVTGLLSRNGKTGARPDPARKFESGGRSTARQSFSVRIQ